MPRLREIADQHGLKLISIAELIAYRRRHEKLVRREAEVEIQKAEAKAEELQILAEMAQEEEDAAILNGSDFHVLQAAKTARSRKTGG